MARIETVTIVNEKSRTGYKIINKSDFDAKKMKAYKGKIAATSDEDAPNEESE